MPETRFDLIIRHVLRGALILATLLSAPIWLPCVAISYLYTKVFEEE